MLPKEFYIVPEEVFRLGNSDSPRLSHVRARDVDTITINEIVVVVANQKGISVFSKDEISKSPMSGWVWKFEINIALPAGLKLVNDRPGHYCIAPTTNMPVGKYKGLLEELGLKASRVYNKPERRA